MKGLALDGGGCFGIGQAQILARVDLSKFDFFVGTSIGSVVAAGLAAGKIPPSDMPKFFNENMPKIFKGYRWRQFNYLSARYPDKELNAVLSKLLPGKYSEIEKPVFITAVNLGSEKLKVFNSLDAADGTWQTWEVCRAAVAAETYFHPWKGYADGGIIVNNPAMVEIAAVSRHFDIPVNEIELCSIGTGASVVPGQKIPQGKWNRARWALWILKTLLNGATNSMHEYFAESMPLKKYLRIQFNRQPGWHMDNPADMKKAQEFWKLQITDAVEKVKTF